MKFTKAIARKPGKSIAQGLTTSKIGLPDIEKTMSQFDAYINTLSDCGIAVTVLEALDDFPDAHYVEDTALIINELAVITNPGAASRKGEIETIAQALSKEKKIVKILPPGIIDGGDVLTLGKECFIGLSERTDEAGAKQLSDFLSLFGYHCTTLKVKDGLHLKSSVNAVSPDTILTTEIFSDHPVLKTFKQIIVPEQEAYASNTLWVNGRLIMPAGYPETHRKLKALGMAVIELDTSEFKKMDGGLSCLSLRF